MGPVGTGAHFGSTCYGEFSHSKFKPHVHFHCVLYFRGSFPSPGLCQPFHNMLSFYSEEFLASCPILKLEDHHWLAVCKCLFSMSFILFSAYSVYSQAPFTSGGCIFHLQPEGTPCCGDGPDYRGFLMQLLKLVYEYSVHPSFISELNFK
jgi:hypothetical protein